MFQIQTYFCFHTKHCLHLPNAIELKEKLFKTLSTGRNKQNIQHTARQKWTQQMTQAASVVNDCNRRQARTPTANIPPKI